jgi:hypothetical protein
VNVIAPQTMHCIICHINPILNVNPKIQTRKRLITYNTTNGIATLRKHVNSNHPNIFFKIEEKINCPFEKDEKQPSKKRPYVYYNYMSSFFVAKKPFKKEDM